MEKLVRRQDDIDTESVSGWVGLEERARFESRSSALSRAIFWVIVKFIEARDRWIINTGRNGRSWIHYPPFHSLERERDFVLASFSFLFHARSLDSIFFFVLFVEMLRLVCGGKKIWRRRRCVRLHRSLNANFNKRGKLRENCDGAKHFLQGSFFFFFLLSFFYVIVQVLLTRPLTLRGTLTFSNSCLILGVAIAAH